MNIEAIYEINKHLKIDQNYPFWYIYSTEDQVNFGPLPSKEIVDLYEKNQIDLSSFIRPIDIFKLKPDSELFDKEIGFKDMQYFELKHITGGIKFFLDNFQLDSAADKIKTVLSIEKEINKNEYIDKNYYGYYNANKSFSYYQNYQNNNRNPYQKRRGKYNRYYNY